MSDRIYFKVYNIFTKKYAVVAIAKDVDGEIASKMFYEKYGKDGWLLVGPVPEERIENE